MGTFVKLLFFGIIFPTELGFSEIVMPVEPEIGPKGMPHNKTTECKTFGKYARFNINSVVGHTWFVFYYWDHPMQATMYLFWVPTLQDKKYLYYVLDSRVPNNFNWSAPMVLMKTSTRGISLLVEKGDRGQYHQYELDPDIPRGQLVKPTELRLKQVQNGTYIGLMFCKQRRLHVMSRIKDVPSSEKLQDEASKLGYVGRKGRSYLYQGHEWMPIPEVDQLKFWEGFLAKTKPISKNINEV